MTFNGYFENATLRMNALRKCNTALTHSLLIITNGPIVGILSMQCDICRLRCERAKLLLGHTNSCRAECVRIHMHPFFFSPSSSIQNVHLSVCISKKTGHSFMRAYDICRSSFATRFIREYRCVAAFAKSFVH